MRTDSEVLKTLGFGKQAVYPLYSYGGKYDLNQLPNGFCPAFNSSWAKEAFSDAANDLVVLTDSALAVGKPCAIDGSCDHFQYFKHAEIANELKHLPGNLVS
jgi:hypothetical protein